MLQTIFWLFLPTLSFVDFICLMDVTIHIKKNCKFLYPWKDAMNVWEHNVHKKEENNTSEENWIKLIWFNPFIIYYCLTKSYKRQVKTIWGRMIAIQTCPLGWAESEIFILPLKLWSWTMKPACSADPKRFVFLPISSCRTVALRKKLCWRTAELQVPPIVRTVYLLRTKSCALSRFISPIQNNTCPWTSYHNVEKTLNYYTSNFMYLKTAPVSPGKSTYEIFADWQPCLFLDEIPVKGVDFPRWNWGIKVNQVTNLIV